jgi:hypothetical protein
MLRQIIKVSTLIFGFAFCVAVQAAPFKFSFSGSLNQIWEEGRLNLGDKVHGEIFYDTDLIDVDPAWNTGFYPGAFAKVHVGEMYFEFSGYIFTNSLAVFSFQSQTPTVVPPGISEFVEFGFYMPVSPGYGADLPTSNQRFSGAPEVAFNFLSIVDGASYYDRADATNLAYTMTPVPEVGVNIYAAIGLFSVLLIRMARRSK